MLDETWYRQALSRCALLLACAALLMGVSRFGLVGFDETFHRTGRVLRVVSGWLGPALTAAGALFLFWIWGACRFRVSIGRFMTVVALLAVLFQVVIVLRQRELRKATPPALAPSTPIRCVVP